MKDLHKVLDVKPLEPLIWNKNSKILDDKNHIIKTLEPFTSDEKHLIFKRKIIAPLIRSQKFNQKKSEKSFDERWLVKSGNDTILGPFTKTEMKNLLDKNELENTFIKKDNEKDFISFELLKENPDFLDTEKINKDLENIKIEESIPFGNDNNKFVIEERKGFYKCKEFLKYKNINLNIETLVKKLYGKNKETAINLIGFLTNLKMEDCDRLVNLIISESGNSVIVDSNGFIKAHNKNTKKK